MSTRKQVLYGNGVDYGIIDVSIILIS